MGGVVSASAARFAAVAPAAAGRSAAFGAAAAAAAWASPARCEDDGFDSMDGFDDVAPPGEEGEGPPMEIVDFDELLNSKTVEVQHNQGLTAVATVPITRLDDVGGMASSRPTFLMQHLFMVGGPNGGQLQSTIINQLDDSNGVTGSAKGFLTTASGAPAVDGVDMSVTAKGSDYALNVNATRGDRMGGDAFKLTYFQSVVQQLALGGFFKAHVRQGTWFGLSPQTAWGVNGAWQSSDMAHAFLGSYNSETSEVSAVYNRSVTEKLSMSAKWTHSDSQGDVVSVGATQPLRIERMLGNAPYTTLAGQVDVHGLAASKSASPYAVVKCSIDHLTLQGQGAFTVSASYDPKHKEYSFGAQFRIQG